MTAPTWRDHARPIIARVLGATRGAPEKEIRIALRTPYPFGAYAYHPLKIWRDEIKRQRGLKPKLGSPPSADPRQLSLLQDEVAR